MKKHLLGLGLLLLCSTTTFAAVSITGVIHDKINDKNLKGVSITLNGESRDASERKGKFTIPNISNAENQPITFTFGDYYTL